MRPIAEGSLVAGYRVETLIAHGGMGVLYRATQLTLGRQVALKVIKPELAEDEEFRARFVLESQIAASIDHPNVIPIHEAAEADGVLFIAMRYVEGTDLARLVARDGALEPSRAVRIVSNVAAALDAAHARGLVHRDVKPANVLVTGSEGHEHVYLTDFGLVKRSASPGGLTKTGEWVGTLDYVAPEQLKGDPVDARADVYALGCLMYHVLTGRVPYPRSDDVAKLWAHLDAPPPSLREQAPTLPRGLDDVVGRSMSKHPGDRFAAAGELGRAAAAALGQPAGSTNPAARSRAPSRSAAQRGLALPQARAARAGLAVVAVLALAVLAAVLLSAGDDDPGREANPAGRVVGRPIPVGSSPSQAVVGGGAVWVTNANDATVSRIDPESSAVLGSPIRVGRGPVFLAIGAATIWVANSEGGTVTRIDGRSHRVEATIGVDGAPFGIAFGKEAVWVADGRHNEVVRIDPASNQVVGRIPVGELPFGVATGAGAVWVTNLRDNTLTKIDPDTNEVVGKPLFVGTEPGGVAVGEGGVWVAIGKDDTVVRVDPASFRLDGKPIRAGRFPDSLTVGAGAVWVANEADDTVTRIDPRTNAVVGRPIRVGRAPSGPATGDGAVWVPNGDDNTVTRIAP